MVLHGELGDCCCMGSWVSVPASCSVAALLSYLTCVIQCAQQVRRLPSGHHGQAPPTSQRSWLCSPLSLVCCAGEEFRHVALSFQERTHDIAIKILKVSCSWIGG